MGSRFDDTYNEYSQVVTTNDYNTLNDLHALEITVTIAHKIKSSTSAY
jgi:hypothetical protein